MVTLAPEEIAESNDVHTAIAITVKRLQRKYSRFVQPDDMRQTMWEYAWRRRETFAEYLNREDEVDRKRGWSALLTSLYRAADRYARKEKAEQSGYRPSDEAFYNRVLIEELMSVRYNGSSLTNQVNDKVKVKTIPGSGYGLETSLADLDKALLMLDLEDRALLEKAFGDQLHERELAEMFEVSRSTIDRRINRACAQVIEYLGGESPY